MDLNFFLTFVAWAVCLGGFIFLISILDGVERFKWPMEIGIILAAIFLLIGVVFPLVGLGFPTILVWLKWQHLAACLVVAILVIPFMWGVYGIFAGMR